MRQVTCGSTIKLEHQGTRAQLHSHEIMYGSGSGQQSVTGNHAGNEAASYWIVRGTEVLLQLYLLHTTSYTGNTREARQRLIGL